MEYKFKSKKNEITLDVQKEMDDGLIEHRVLIFDCSPNNYSFVKKVSQAGALLNSAIKKANAKNKDIDDSMLLMDQVVEAEKQAFEAAAPGKWDEFFEFVDSDIVNMSELLTLMVSTITDKGIESKKEAITTAVPDGESI